jgi:hypothetical protein
VDGRSSTAPVTICKIKNAAAIAINNALSLSLPSPVTDLVADDLPDDVPRDSSLADSSLDDMTTAFDFRFQFTGLTPFHLRKKVLVPAENALRLTTPRMMQGGEHRRDQAFPLRQADNGG